MKRIIAILTLCILIACSSENESEQPETIPNAPKNLVGNVISETQVNLSWTDNSANETGFKIARKTGAENYAVIGTVNSNLSAFNDDELLPNTTYFYRISSFNAIGDSSTYSNEISLTTNSQDGSPNLETKIITEIRTSSAAGGGIIHNNGSSSIIAKGIVWSANPIPTIDLLTKTNNGSGPVNFTSSITGLLSNTTYYVRAYATNSTGTSYGNQVSFTTSPPVGIVTDIDGNTYDLITICNQTWTKSNLNVSRYRNGDIIPEVQDYTQWQTLTTGAWCYYANETSNGTIYGKLYNWYAVTDPRGLAPAGFHIPNIEEWDTMFLCLGDTGAAGGKMKETGTLHWNSPNTAATNSSEFTGLPGGRVTPEFGFNRMGNNGTWWSRTTHSDWPRNAFVCGLQFDLEFAARTIYNKKNGYSVRCVKD